MKKLLKCIMVIWMAAVLSAGCGKKADVPVAGERIDTGVSDKTERYFGAKEHYTIKVMCFGNADKKTLKRISEQISKYTEPALNSNVEITRIGFGNYSTQLSLKLFSREKFDLFIPMEQPAEYINAGLLQPVTELIPRFAPHVNADFQKDDWVYNTFNGEIYGLPTYGQKGTVLGVGMRKDICDELGIDYKNMKSWDDFHDALVKVKKAYPEMYPLAGNEGHIVDGERGFAGQDSCGDDYNLAVLADPFDPEAVVESWPETEQFKEVCNRMYEWAQEGLVQPDASASTDQVNDLVSEGKAFSYFQQMKPGWEEEQTVRNNYTTVSWKCGTPVYIGCQKAWFVPATSEDPERAVAFYDMLYSNKKLANLVINGIEGENYVFADDSRSVITFPQGINEATTSYSRLPWEWPNQSLSFFWKNEDPAVWEKSEEFNRICKKGVAYGFRFDATPVISEVTACISIYDKYVPALLCGTLNPDQAIPKLNEELKKAGIEKIVNEKQKQLNSYLAGSQ